MVAVEAPMLFSALTGRHRVSWKCGQHVRRHQECHLDGEAFRLRRAAFARNPAIGYEKVHRIQWNDDGPVYHLAYLRAGPNPFHNRVETQTGFYASSDTKGQSCR